MAARLKYDQIHDGDTVTPVMHGYRWKCCDCGLVHTLNFKIINYPNNRHELQFTVARFKPSATRKVE